MARFLSIALFAATVCSAQTTNMRGINSHYEWKPYTARPAWEARRVELKQRILTSAGLDPMPAKTPLKARSVKQAKTELAMVETVLLETMPGFFMGANLYRPLKATAAKMPAVLIPHGHWANGRVHHEDVYSPPALAMNLARQGYVAMTVDMVGYNDTNQHDHRFGGREEDMWSYTPLGLQLWNSVRALDFLQSLPEVDGERLAMTGASGGGTQTFLLSAIDDRVKVVAPVNMISSYMQGGCVCEGAPGLRVDTFNVEIAAIVAPRPMLMVSCTGDWTQHTPKEEFPLMQKMYDLYDARARLENAHINAQHNYNADSRAAVYRFLAKHMQPGLKEEDLVERPVTGFQAADLLAASTAPKPSAADLFSAWKAMSRQQFQTTSNVSVVRERLRRVFHLDHLAPAAVQAVRKPGKGAPMLVVYSGITEAPAELWKTDRPVVFLPLYRHADGAVPAERSYHTYNLSQGVLQVQDILRALETMPGDGPIEIVPVGDTVLPALFAAALTSKPARLHATNLAKVQTADREKFFVPGIERAGSIEAAMRLLDGNR